MSIKFTALVRLPGKICQKIVTNCDFATVEVANTANHKEAPYSLLSLPNEPKSFILVLPVLDIDQTCEITLKNSEGAIVEKTKKTFSPKLTALESKKNSALNKEEANYIRQNCETLLNNETNLNLAFAFFNPSAQTRTLRINIDALLSEAANGNAPFEVELFDARFNHIEQKYSTILSEKVKPVAYSKVFTRSVIYSATIDANISSLLIWLRFADPNTSGAFLCLLPFMYDPIKDESDRIQINNSGVGPAYHDWFITQHRATHQELVAQKSNKFDINPLYSIIVPLFKTPSEYFKEMADSVLAQTYGNFELILINASPEDTVLKDLVGKYESKDNRIVVINLDDNYGITLNTNEGIKAAKGDFLCFFDHDDILEPNLLFEYTKAINLYPDTDLLYCDEDKFADGRYFDGNLKPDFDWDLLRGFNYVCHLLAVRKSIVDSFDQLPGKEYDGAQDYNMTLKVAEQARNIYHVRKVLYHWRSHPTSTAANLNAKPWAHNPGKLAVQEHLSRIGIDGEVLDHPEMSTWHEIYYALPEKQEKVSIVIPTKDGINYLKRCINSIEEKSTYRNYEIVLVENNSTEQETFDYYDELTKQNDNIRVITYEVPGFDYSAICNLGAKHAEGKYLIFLNNDTEVITPNWIELMVGHLQRPKVGCVGANLYYPDNTIQHTRVVFPKSVPGQENVFLPKDAPDYMSYIKVAKEGLAITGACQGIRKNLFDSFGGFSKDFPVAYNDVDLCLRLYETGYLIVAEPRINLYHYESVSRGLETQDTKTSIRFVADKGRLMERYPKYFVTGDPYYNSNFAASSGHHELDWSPREGFIRQ